jgi:hypothetical protein
VGRTKLKKKKAAKPIINPLRAGLPAKDSITGVDQYGSGKNALRVIHTTERDAYDKVPRRDQRKKG